MATSEARGEDSNNTRPPNAGTAASSPAFDVNAAVETYLAKMPAGERVRSNAYFEGGYWLQLWDFLSTVVVMWLLLRFRLSMRMRDFAERITRFRPLQTAIFCSSSCCSWQRFRLPFTKAIFANTNTACRTKPLVRGCATKR
jgi:hypothetical protein